MGDLIYQGRPAMNSPGYGAAGDKSPLDWQHSEQAVGFKPDLSGAAS
jgi:hypothetical protein